jgi:hypothetical protein
VSRLHWTDALAHAVIQVSAALVGWLVWDWRVALVPLAVAALFIGYAVVTRWRAPRRRPLLHASDVPLCVDCGHPAAAHQLATGCGTVTDHLLCGCAATAPLWRLSADSLYYGVSAPTPRTPDTHH